MIDISMVELIFKAESGYLFMKEWNNFSDKELSHICNHLDYINIEDRYLCDIPELHQYIQWKFLDKMQAIRIVTRHPELLEKIDLNQYTYKLKDIWYFVQADYTRLFKYFNFDFKNLNKEDAYFLLCLGKNNFLDLINIPSFNFNHIEILNIIKAYKCEREILLKLNYKLLNAHQITEILVNTGIKLLDLFNINELTTLNWLELLSYHPVFLSYCDFRKFTSGDPFNLIQLISMFKTPDLFYLIDEIDVQKITAFGWEKLLISHPEKSVLICDFKKLKENNWVLILKENPELESYKDS